MIHDLRWMDEGSCRETDADLFFMEGQERPRWERLVIRTYCRGCSVVSECREYALSHPEPQYGVWGGLGQREIGLRRQERGLSGGVAARRTRGRGAGDAEVA